MGGKGKKFPEKIQQVWRRKEPSASLVELPRDVSAPLKMRGKGKKFSKKMKQVWRKKQPPSPPWVELPEDITANILHRLGAVEILETAQKVCTTWRKVCKDPTFWRVIDMENLGDLHNMSPNLDIMCRHAVDRSQGQLIDINIEYFGTDDLLEYIADRCSQLKRLRMSHCYSLSGKALSRFPLLEELHLIFTLISSESLEMVGRLCPLLKSLSWNYGGIGFPFDDDSDELALTIAKSMPELQHLQLIGDSLTNKGLVAILDSCRHLESLDLRRCYGLDLSGELLKGCSQRIKSLRRPCDYAPDYEFEGGSDLEFYPFSELEYEDYLDYDDYSRWDHEDYWDEEDFDFGAIFGFF